MVSIDMAKAFDSVDHSYLEKVYGFFGFGERIRKWLKVIGTNRKAMIIMGTGKYSSIFRLDRGTAQGDSPSPFLYNLAAQILLWKLEYDPEMEGIYPDPNIIGNRPFVDLNSTSYFAHESNNETSRNESFADDSNNFLILNFNSLNRLKTILEQFRELSGLSCNVEKSFVMRIGDDTGPIDQSIIDIGFPFVNQITVLGFVLRNDGIEAVNFEKTKTKIANIIRFWERFNLTVPGKIAIYKTLLLPHLNFLSTIITPSEFYLNEFTSMFENFVSKGIKIGKSRLYQSPDRGGLGMFNLTTFVAALQCTWARRAKIRNDNWKNLLCDLGGGGARKSSVTPTRPSRIRYCKYCQQFTIL